MDYTQAVQQIINITPSVGNTGGGGGDGIFDESFDSTFE